MWHIHLHVAAERHIEGHAKAKVNDKEQNKEYGDVRGGGSDCITEYLGLLRNNIKVLDHADPGQQRVERVPAREWR